MLKVLGDPDDPRTEVEKVLACADVEEGVPRRGGAHRRRAANDGARRRPDDRADLRHVPFTTIDPETARDFDDAVALEKLPHGGRALWVAVADVSHYVREGSPIDTEARRRGVSIYLPSRAIPMLPEPLSARLCSLVPEEDRCAMVVRIDLDRHAQVIGTRLLRRDHPFAGADGLPGRRRGAGGGHPRQAQKYEPFLPALRAMDALARQLRARGRRAGHSTSTSPSRSSSWTTTTPGWCATSRSRGAIRASGRPTR